MKRILSALAALFFIASPAAQAANSTVSAMTAASALGGTELLYVVQGAADRKGTPAQFATYIYGLASGDCTISGVGAVVCTKTNGVAFTALATTAPGTGVATALGVNVGSAGAFVTFNGALGTPSSGTLTNATGLPVATGVSGLATGIATWLAIPSSANLLAALTSKTGTGNAVFGSAPTIDSLNATTAMTLAFLTGAGTQCLQVSNTGVVSGTAAACGGSGATGANPTATAGPTAVNGAAATFMRSDGAPAIQLGTAAQKGIVQVDNTTITASGGVISAVNTGTVTSVAAGCGTSTGGSPITTTGTLTAALTRRANATTSDAIVSTDCGNVVSESNAGSIAVTIAQAGTTGFGAGTYFLVCNIGVGTATITPTTSTIGGASTLPIPGGSAAAPVCYAFQSDGTNYNLVEGPTVNAALLTAGTLPAGRMPALTGDVTSSAGSIATTLAAGSASNLNSGTLAAARGGAGTINGALKGNGSGVVSQAACADLSNAGALCPVAPGTGVATAAAVSLSGAGGLTSTIASGTAALGTGAITSGTCATVVTVAASNVATTDIVTAGFAADPTATTGYLPTAMLTIVPYPTSGNVNFKVCNLTGSSITPSAVTINWRVTR